ncbi:aminotransferase class I/II-fold pyridoxal phosphate-dependent enzyme [Streptomyces sp. VRA16 Mangrove soil]|uniref:aminotransferase class I/II-fold pyridoxal phosphate-dependent enzyme n=1 Tax=Streptomyces sp. VRA16 Mangrove soil TaxID=2817434 RepID=UPI001A9F9C60|nr:aminotransferase class I/II-fold pyridoxal phosphate-dependent enzyme [Streptomyces sp. VRA16 Mangrove soil]MBO1331085.1 aminotransferase class I/II-fold pyridoxal phosphate-dependent enzyme [Streptomyces sp. VRA16 Mangrove soil]
MRHPDPEGRGPVRYGPPLPEPGLPVLPELAAVVAAAAARAHPEPPGGPPALLEAARGHGQRRGLAPERARVTAAPGAAPLLLALTAALGGDVLVPRPCPAWWVPQARLIGRDVFHVPTPAECGGVPDPYALLETVRRVRAEGGDPRLLVVSVADDPTATVPPPEVLHEAVEAAVGEGLHVVSDETWRDTVHPGPDGSGPGTVLFSPAEMFPGRVTVLTDLTGAYLPPSLPAACARFAPTAEGDRLAARTLDILTATGAHLAAPVAAAATYVLEEGAEVTARRTAAVALHARVAAALHRTVLAAGGLARPPRAGRHLYVDLERLRPRLSARGVTDAQDLEEYLTDRLGMPAPGGHRFGDDQGALRVRLCTGPLLGSTPAERAASLTSPEPLGLPHVARVLSMVESVLGELRDPGDRADPEGTGAAGEGWESER